MPVMGHTDAVAVLEQLLHHESKLYAHFKADEKPVVTKPSITGSEVTNIYVTATGKLEVEYLEEE